jgi:hypothetical protein
LPTDASGDGASPASCGCANAGDVVACEDFEPVAGASWSVFGDAPPVADASRAYCGRGSLRVHAPALSATESFSTGLGETASLSDPRLASGFFMRAWVYQPSTSTIPQGNWASLLETRQDASPYLGIATQLFGSAPALSDWTTTPTAFDQASLPLPLDKWTCVEWQVTFGAPTGSARLWMNGVMSPSASLDHINTQPSPAYTAILMGLLFYAAVPQAAFDVWIDDVIIDAKRIGCAS